MRTLKQHGMLYMAAMVQALMRLVNPKIMTRRNITFHNSTTGGIVSQKNWKDLRWEEATRGREYPKPGVVIPFWQVPFRDIEIRVYPSVRPGDIIWVRETWAAPHKYDGFKPSEIPQDANIHYKASEDLGGLLQRVSIHMPRWTSRIDLEVLKVGSQRIQEISEADALNEGIEKVGQTMGRSEYPMYGPLYTKLGQITISPQYSFRCLWNSINAAKGFGWEVNHPVWIYEFKRVKPA